MGGQVLGVDARRAAPWRPPQALWSVLVIAVSAGVVVDRFHALPDRISSGLAAAFGVLVIAGLSARLGNRLWVATGIALVYAAVAVGLQNQLMLRGAALITAATVSVFAVVVTVPAPRFRRAVVEVVLADAVALVGAFAVVAYHLDLNGTVFRYTVLVLALGGAFVGVYQPGAGLHGLGRRGYALIGGLVVLLVFAVAYSLALTHWGSHYVADTVDGLRSWTHDTLGAAPHLLEVIVGVPSLCWGVFTRARRRQGWWMCAFGVAMTGPTATALIDGAVNRVAFLGCVYSVALGVAVGFVVVRVEQTFTGSRGRRARRVEEASAHRPEALRWEPLR
ncbi:MAG: hypothetical protein NVSMB48_11840 [Marmoricola sp.]